MDKIFSKFGLKHYLKVMFFDTYELKKLKQNVHKTKAKIKIKTKNFKKGIDFVQK